jgi:hypothetical protein
MPPTPARCSDSQRTSGPAPKRRRKREMRTALAGRRLNLRWNRSKDATQSPPQPARRERRSSASWAQPPAAPYTADTRCYWNTPRRLLRKFRSCNADKCERPRLTSQFKRLTINETMPQRKGKAHERGGSDWNQIGKRRFTVCFCRGRPLFGRAAFCFIHKQNSPATHAAKGTFSGQECSERNLPARCPRAFRAVGCGPQLEPAGITTELLVVR